jgi:hypothetical protein
MIVARDQPIRHFSSSSPQPLCLSLSYPDPRMKIAADALILPCVSVNLATHSAGFAGRKV